MDKETAKEKAREYLKRHRQKYNNTIIKCKVCEKEYKKCRKWEHQKTQFHQLAFFKNQVDELNKNI